MTITELNTNYVVCTLSAFCLKTLKGRKGKGEKIIIWKFQKIKKLLRKNSKITLKCTPLLE